MSKPFLGFHYDIARGTYLKPEYFRRALKLAAEAGYTHFLPYLENMIRLPSMARACPSCAYTAEDWQQFDAVARDSGIELVPHFNVIGHTELICPVYPELGGEVDRGHKDVDVERRETREWTLRCLGEFCEFSNSRYFLIGGDEWQPPRHMLARPGFDVARAWVDQINMAVEFLAKKGRKPIVWHDMLIHFPAALESLSRKAVIAFWFYDQDSDYPALDLFKKRGFETLMATAVFGGGTPTMGHRCLNALHTAADAAKRHQCDGTIVTSWEFCRWEFESFNIPMAARVLRGETPPAAIVDTFSLLSALLKLPTTSTVANKWKARIIDLSSDPAWVNHPELRRVALACVNGNTKDDIASYSQFHFPQGRGYDHVAKGYDRPQWPAGPLKATRRSDAIPFGLKITSDPKAGDVLQFFNGNESFEVYPKFGASLQNWCSGDNVIIPGSMEGFLKRDALPCGYRSYAAAGGLRSIWGFGTHSNPCILWQHPWRWSVVEQTSDRVAVELSAEFVHVTVRVRIAIERGRTGFIYESHGSNKLEHAYGVFNFNLPLFFHLGDLDEMKLGWQENGRPRTTTLSSKAEGGFWIPARGPLTVENQTWSLTIDADAESTAGYFVDWGAGFITPDLHGVYRPLRRGDEIATRWCFKLA